MVTRRDCLGSTNHFNLLLWTFRLFWKALRFPSQPAPAHRRTKLVGFVLAS